MVTRCNSSRDSITDETGQEAAVADAASKAAEDLLLQRQLLLPARLKKGAKQ